MLLDNDVLTPPRQSQANFGLDCLNLNGNAIFWAENGDIQIRQLIAMTT